MKKVEIILVLLAILGLLLSIFLIAGGNFTIIMSLSSLSMLYFYFSFALLNGIRFRNIFKKSSYVNIKTLRIVGAIGTGITLSIVLIGIMFKAMSWPGAGVMLLYGIIGVLIPAIAAGVKYAVTKEKFYSSILLHVVPAGIVAAIFFLFGGEIFYDFKYRNYPEFLKAYYKAKDNPYDEELWMKVEEERRKIQADE